MSTQFDFSVDFNGTLTPVSTGSHPRVLQSSAQGVEPLAHVDCHVKRFLHAIEVKGLKVCKDLQIMDGGELLIRGTADDTDDSVDFTGAELVKEVELVFGTVTVTGSGTDADPFVSTLTPANPADKFITAPGATSEGDLSADDSAYGAETIVSSGAVAIADTDKWYLRLIKADGSSDYEAFDAVNHLLGDAGGAAGVNLLAKMQEVKSVQDALEAAFEARNVARRDRVDVLENKIDLDFTDLVAYLTHVETSLKQHSDDQNQLIHDYAMDRIAEMELSVQTASNDVRLHAELNVTPVDTCPADTEEVFQAVVGDAFADVEKWFIDVGIVKAGQRRADIDVQWEAEVIDDAPGIGTILILFFIHSFTSNLPGSDNKGVPASEIKDKILP